MVDQLDRFFSFFSRLPLTAITHSEVFFIFFIFTDIATSMKVDGTEFVDAVIN